MLIGCSASSDEAINQSKKIAETTFQEKAKTPTETTKGFSYYLPKGFKIDEKFENNVILKKEKQEYILFVNPHEPLKSDVLFNELKKSGKDEKSIATFKDDNRFGYISITPVKDRKYEVIVGIGGVKMTTLTSASDMVSNTKDMMEIAHSVQYGKEKGTAK